jgi:sugar phosphate isomerase/epimerase
VFAAVYAADAITGKRMYEEAMDGMGGAGRRRGAGAAANPALHRKGRNMLYTRRDVGKVALASLPLARVLNAANINSKFNGVQIGAISYSFNRIANPDATAIIKAMVEIGLGEVELMSNHCESLAGIPTMPQTGGGGFGGGGGAARGAAGAPAGAAAGAGAGRQGGGAPAGAQAGAPGGAQAQAGAAGAAAGAAGQARGARGGGRAPLTPEQQAASDEAQKKIAAWRAAATPDTWKAVRKKWNDAGIDVALLCYNMRDNMKDEDIEYGFKMAKGLGVKGMTTSTTLTMAKRIAPIADKYKLLVGYHGHDQTNDPNETATLESYDTLMAYGKLNGINLDIGHFTASNYDAVAFIQKHHAKITNLHLKDRKKDHGPGVPWGTGDTPIKEVLQLIKKNKYPIPCNLEWEIAIPQGSTLNQEMKNAVEFCRKALA